jgi:hypothetical protein
MDLEPYFDIFRKETGGNVLWIDIAETLSGAIKKAREAMTVDGASYLLVNSRTGEKTVISRDSIES